MYFEQTCYLSVLKCFLTSEVYPITVPMDLSWKSFKYQKCVIVMIVCTIIYLIYVYYTNNQDEYEIVTIQKLPPPGYDIKGPHKYILLYTSFFESSTWYLGKKDTYSSDFFRQIKCPNTDCTVTNDKELLPNLTEFHAVIFHGSTNWRAHVTPPEERIEKQLYVVALKESPVNTRAFLDKESNFYNWTMSYRLDSDILWNYGAIVDKKTQTVIATGRNGYPMWVNTNTSDESLIEVVQKKTKQAAWFVSHCKTDSKREKLVEALQKYISVDVYGACGNNEKCPRSNPKACVHMLTNDYKFYLSFENSLCTDYVTEKFFNAMTELVIPIVYGGSDYTKFAPPDSYIDANSFHTVQQLGEYLQFLDRNEEEYIKYFRWKQHYQVEGGYQNNAAPFCQICTKLHDPNIQARTFIYKDLFNWWKNNICQHSPMIQF